jgi:hypothetical protein
LSLCGASRARSAYLGPDAVDEAQEALPQHILLQVIKERVPWPKQSGEDMPLVHRHRVVCGDRTRCCQYGGNVEMKQMLPTRTAREVEEVGHAMAKVLNAIFAVVRFQYHVVEEILFHYYYYYYYYYDDDDDDALL